MKCKYPVYLEKGRAYGCGQCVTCRINKRREWANRMVLEAAQYEDNAFVTLTFDDENLPEDLCVNKRDIQLFLKRLRYYHAVEKIRYFAVGEYGETTHRPHYHLLLFNFPTCVHGRTRIQLLDLGQECCQICTLVAKSWNMGHVFLGEVSPDSAGYVAGYAVKGWNNDEIPIERDPEFALAIVTGKQI